MKIYVLLLIFIGNVKKLKCKQNTNQCGLSELEENIKRLQSLEPRLFFPTLKELKKRYPGDKFRETDQTECLDVESKDLCMIATKYGNCNGTNHKVTFVYCSKNKLEDITNWVSGNILNDLNGRNE